MNIYTIPEVERDNVAKMIERCEKKAAVYGKHIVAEFGSPYGKKRAIYESNGREQFKVGEEIIEVFDLSLESDIIRKDGYTVVAKIEHLEGGNIVKTIGCDIKQEWITAYPKCEHCGSHRDRKLTYIVRSEDGIDKQVGRSCLKDYCGIDPQLIAAFHELDDLIIGDDLDNWDFDERPITPAYDAVQAFALAIKIVKRQGYIKSEEQGSNRDILKSEYGNYRPTDMELSESESILNEIKVMDDDIARDFLLNNVKTLALCGYCKASHFGFIAYAPVAYERYKKKLEDDAKRNVILEDERMVSDYVGAVGERITVDVAEMKLITSVENYYGTTFIYKFKDGKGNVLVWFASRRIEECHAIKATVKEHNERDGVKQTIITRCKAA